jgi:D-threo-aldose 1-dehydrogenase
MQEIRIGATGRLTSRLGYGCSSVMGGLGRKESLAILEGAFDAGIRHYDVAPMYGYGEAEGCLGEFLRRHPGRVTVTTKYGIPAAKSQSMIALARTLARPILKRLPGLKQQLSRAASKTAVPEARATFTAAQARESLERSLLALGVEHIDVWLLHEVESQDLADDGLLRLLQEMVTAGKIGTFGIGSEAGKVAKLLQLRPEYCQTLQYEWSVLDPGVASGTAFRIHHRALTNHFRQLHAALVADPSICKRWSENVGLDLNSAETLASLMLKASLVMNPESIILFSSKRREHVEANVRIADSVALEAPASILYHLVQTERHSLLGQPASPPERV